MELMDQAQMKPFVGLSVYAGTTQHSQYIAIAYFIEKDMLKLWHKWELSTLLSQYIDQIVPFSPYPSTINCFYWRSKYM